MGKVEIIKRQVGEISKKFDEGQSYRESLDSKIKNYFSLLEPNWPEWLDDYIAAKEVLFQKFVSTTCGTIYSKMYSSEFFYSNLDHSVGVALIVWHFTHDKRQTLAGLFHDIATPTFKHCVDFMNGDYLKQESTEDLTHQIIVNSRQIMKLLKRDNISVSEIDNYHNYPVADNDMPKLSADRLEYTLSNSLLTYCVSDYEHVKKFYEDVEIQKNEMGEVELGFKTLSICNEFVKVACKLSKIYVCDKTRFSMQLIADLLKRLSEENIIKIEDLYTKKEIEIVELIESSKYGEIFDKWSNATKIKTSRMRPKNIYSVKIDSKIRYINPICNGKRITQLSKTSKKLIESVRGIKFEKFVFLDFNL